MNRSRRRKVNHEIARLTGMQAKLEWRARRGWLVQVAAWTRSWRLIQLASWFVRIEGRPKGAKGWVELDVRTEISRDGSVHFLPLQGAR